MDDGVPDAARIVHFFPGSVAGALRAGLTGCIQGGFWHAVQNPRFIVFETCPERLIFRDAEVALEIIQSEDGAGRPLWKFCARKVAAGDQTVLTFEWALYHKETLDRIIHETGFMLREGSPEARLLEILISRGHAQRLPSRA